MKPLFLQDEAATASLARVLAARAPKGAMVHLQGDLGAGKSTMARAWLRALGVTGPVRSPTYTLVERYPLAGGGEALHLDLYRIGGAAELDFLGLDDVDPALWLVEWPERGASALPAADLALGLCLHDTGRLARLTAHSARGAAWLAALEQDGALQAVPEPYP
jgi:tRNA threonylcarbamoyladenosine biosynthesis protein TsaE